MFFHTLGVSGTIGSGKSVRVVHICNLVSRWFGSSVLQGTASLKKSSPPLSKCPRVLRSPSFPIHTELIQADKVAHRLYAPGTPCYHEIVKEFGSRILLQESNFLSSLKEHDKYATDGTQQEDYNSSSDTKSRESGRTVSSSQISSLSSLPHINRKHLGEIVFSDPKKLAKLNLICRSRIEETIITSISSVKEESLKLFNEKNSNARGVFVVVEAALLGNLELVVKQCDDIWLLHCDRDIAINRVMKRDKMDAIQAKKRVNSQKTTDEMFTQLKELSFEGEILPVDTSKGTVEEGLEAIEKLFHSYWVRRVNHKCV